MDPTGCRSSIAVLPSSSIDDGFEEVLDMSNDHLDLLCSKLENIGNDSRRGAALETTLRLDSWRFNSESAAKS